MGTCKVHVESCFYVQSLQPFVGQVKIVSGRYTFILTCPSSQVPSKDSVKPVHLT